MKTRAENRLDLIAAAAAFVQAAKVEIYHAEEAGTMIASVELSNTMHQVRALAHAALNDLAIERVEPGRRRKGDA